MNYEPEPEENRLDQTLRDKFADFELAPGAPVWAGIEGRIGQLPPARRPRRWLPVPLALMLTAVVSGLGGWLLPHGEVAGKAKPAPVPYRSNSSITASTRPIADGNAPTKTGTVLTKTGTVLTKTGTVLTTPETVLTTPGTVLTTPGTAPTTPPTMPTTGLNLLATAAATSGGAPVTTAPVGAAVGATMAADSTPVLLRPLALLELAYQAQPKHSLTDPASASREALITTLRAERHEMLRLQRRTDSLLLALGDVLPANPALAAKPDTAELIANSHQLKAKKWSLLLTAAPEQNYLGFDAPARDELTNLRRNQETGRAGLNAALLAEYQATKRVSIGAGLGYSSYGAELRQAVRSTDYQVTGYDTSITQTTRNFTSTYNTYSIRIIQIPQLNPVFNASGQVLRYDTVYVPRNDTLRSVITSNDVVHDTVRTLVPRLLPVVSTTYKTYRPDYRFFTVPFAVRYRLAMGAGSRMWTDVAVGAQLQFFLGGTQLVSNDDGQSFHTQTVKAGEGPFRPLNVALAASLNLNYALNPRLSVSIGPSLRWQALSVFKPETGLRQKPTATGLQVGVGWKL